MNISALVNKTLGLLGAKIVRIDEPVRLPGNCYELSNPQDSEGKTLEARKLLNLLSYTKANTVSYNGAAFDVGYHTITIDGEVFPGQRNPADRLKDVPYNFAGATVLDLGCNQGGMLLALADQIREGVGIDYDYKMVNAANRIGASRGLSNLHYYVFNLESERLELLGNFPHSNTVDIVFLLSICMWIGNWREVINAAQKIAPSMLFESNGSDQQQAEQEAHLRATYQTVIALNDTSHDDPLQKQRKGFLCTNAQDVATHATGVQAQNGS